MLSLQVTVDRPDVQGRVRILKVHSRGKQIGKDVDFEKIARRTPGNICALWRASQSIHLACLHLVAYVICYLYCSRYIVRQASVPICVVSVTLQLGGCQSSHIQVILCVFHKELAVKSSQRSSSQKQMTWLLQVSPALTFRTS